MFLAGHTVAMVTYCVGKLITTCSLMAGQFLDTIIVGSSDYNEPSKSKCWKLFWATLIVFARTFVIQSCIAHIKQCGYWVWFVTKKPLSKSVIQTSKPGTVNQFVSLFAELQVARSLRNHLVSQCSSQYYWHQFV